MKTPEDLGGLRSAMGLFAWLSPFVEKFAEWAAPLYEMERGLKKRGDRLVWTPEAQEGWRTLKRVITTPQADGGILRAWDFAREARLETDTSK